MHLQVAVHPSLTTWSTTNSPTPHYKPHNYGYTTAAHHATHHTALASYSTTLPHTMKHMLHSMHHMPHTTHHGQHTPHTTPHTTHHGHHNTHHTPHQTPHTTHQTLCTTPHSTHHTAHHTHAPHTAHRTHHAPHHTAHITHSTHHTPCMLIICPSLRAAPRTRHKVSTNRSKLAEVRNIFGEPVPQQLNQYMTEEASGLEQLEASATLQAECYMLNRGNSGSRLHN